MDNEINEIIRKEKMRERLMLILCIMAYFLCFALSEAYDNYVFSDWLFEMHKNI